jgi:hypothetical protein
MSYDCFIPTKEKRTDKLLPATSQCALGCYDIIITVARILYHNSLSFVNWQITRRIICFPVDRRKEYIFEEKQQFNTTAQSELPYADEQNGVLRWYGFACYQLQCIGAS